MKEDAKRDRLFYEKEFYRARNRIIEPEILSEVPLDDRIRKFNKYALYFLLGYFGFSVFGVIIGYLQYSIGEGRLLPPGRFVSVGLMTFIIRAVLIGTPIYLIVLFFFVRRHRRHAMINEQERKLHKKWKEQQAECDAYIKARMDEVKDRTNQES